MTPHDEPVNAIERAADAAMEAALGSLLAAGGSIRFMFVSIIAGGLPEPELDAVTAAIGDELPDDLDERAREMLALLVSEAVTVGRSIGLEVRIVPMGAHGQG